MNKWGDLASEVESMHLGVQEKPPGPDGYKPLDRKTSEIPSIFVRTWLLWAVSMAVILALFLFFCFRSPARLTPDYRRSPHGNHRQYIATTAKPLCDTAQEILWVGSIGAGIQRFDPGSLYWEHNIDTVSTKGALITNNVVGLDISENEISYVCQDEVRRGLVFSAFSTEPTKNMFWKLPFLDLSHLGQSSGDSLTCVARGEIEDMLLMGSRDDGIGRYELSSRHWLDNITKETGQISDNHIYDLCYSDVGLLVANGNGIDICYPGKDKWKLHNTISGLASRGVKCLYPLDRISSLSLWFISVGQGLGEVQILPEGVEGKRTTLVSERSVPDLTLEACKDAAYEKNSGSLWVAFKQKNKVGLARYRFRDHDWLGSSEPVAAEEIFCLGIQQNGSGLVGTENGIWQASDAGGENIEVAWRGPPKEKITEIASLGQFIWAHSLWQPPAGQSSTRIRFVSEDNPSNKGWKWRDFIGPARFPALQSSDILCVARCGNTDKYYFGTRGKGIGVFAEDSHEIFQRFYEDSNHKPDGLPSNTILDLACPDEENILAVSGDNSLMTYDGKRWDVQIGKSALKGKAQNVTCAAASGDNITIGADPLVGSYEMASHTWRQLPNLPGIIRLQSTWGPLWGLTKERQLFELLSDDWTLKAEKVAAFTGSKTMVAALLDKTENVRQLVFSRPNTTDLAIASNPVPLGYQVARWDTVCADKTNLFLAGEDKKLARYDLLSHEWEVLEWPKSISNAVKLEATNAGLWMLGEEGNLELWKVDTRRWTEKPIQTNISNISDDGSNIIAILRGDSTGEGNSPGLVKFASDTDSQTLIGRAIKGNPDLSQDAAEHEGKLFLGLKENITWYNRDYHDWKRFKLEEANEFSYFAATDRLLFAKFNGTTSNAGYVACYQPGYDEFEYLPDPEKPGKRLIAERIAAGQQELALQRPGSDVLLAMNAAPRNMIAVYPYSRIDLDSSRITAAAEEDSELYLGANNGGLFGYQRHRNGLNHWKTIVAGTESTKDAANIYKKILLFDQGKTMVVVREHSIDVLTRDSRDSENWQQYRSIISNAKNCDAWDSGSNSILYAAVLNEIDNDGGYFSEVRIASPTGISSNRLVVGEGLARENSACKTTKAVAEFKTPSDTLLFRADSNGMLGQYSFRYHKWKREGVSGIKGFFESMGTLWAYAQENKSLYRLVSYNGDYVWQNYAKEGAIADLAYDKDAILLRYDGGGRIELVELETAGVYKATCLVESFPSSDRADFSDLVASAEVDGDLLCSFATGTTYRYRIKDHAWSKTLNAGVRQFLKIKGQTEILYALLADGKLVKWISGKDGRFEYVTAPEKAARIVQSDNKLCLFTEQGGLYLLDGGDKWIGLAGPEFRLEGEGWPAVTSVTEWKGCLFLGLVRSAGTEIVCYNPVSMSWRKYKISEGIPERFVVCSDKLLVVISTAANTKRLCWYDSSSDTFVVIGKDFRRLVEAEEQLWGISGDGAILRVEVATMKEERLTPDNLSLALPTDQPINDLNASGNDLVAVLGDGSVWHHSVDAIGWRQLLPKLPDTSMTFKRSLIDVNGYMATSTPQGEVLIYDGQKDTYADINSESEFSKTTKQTEKKWKVRKIDGKLEVNRIDSDQWVSLVGNKLLSDEIIDLCVDKQYIYCRTAASTIRVLDWNSLKEANSNITIEQFREKVQQHSPLGFDGKEFVCILEPNGLWKTTEKGINCNIAQKKDSSGKELEKLIPYSAEGQAGLIQQWIHSPVSKDNLLFTAIPGGIIQIKVEEKGIKILKTYMLGIGTDVPDLAKADEKIICRIGNKGSMIYDVEKDGWFKTTGNDGPNAEKAFGLPAQRINNSEIGAVWALTGNEESLIGLTTLDGKKCNLKLGVNGFGLDRIAAMILGEGVIELYSGDGLVMYQRRQPGGRPQSIQQNMAVSAEMAQNRYQLIKNAGLDQPVLLSWDDKAAWKFKDKWQATESAGIVESIIKSQPFLLKGNFCNWTRDESVELKYQGEQKEIKTKFNLDTGRFGIDQINSIGAINGELLATSSSGICWFGDSSIKGYFNESSAYKWTKGSYFSNVNFEGKNHLYVHLLSTSQAKISILRFDGREWAEVSNKQEIEEVDKAAEWLLRGEQWQVHRDQITNSSQLVFYKHWDWQKAGEFTKVSIDLLHSKYPGSFDFERINDMIIHDRHLLLATDGSVVHVDIASRKVTALTTPLAETKVTRIIKKEGVVYAEAGGRVFSWNSSSNQWIEGKGTGIFEKSDTLVAGKQWEIRRDKNKLLVKCRLSQADQGLADVSFCEAGSNLFRFDFDTVLGVAANKNVLAVLTKRGVILRHGRLNSEVKIPALPMGLDKLQDCNLFAYGKKGQKQIFLKNDSTLIRYQDNIDEWHSVGEDEKNKIDKLIGKILTWNDNWLVCNNDTSEPEIAVRFPDDVDYKPAKFISDKGLFGFDIFHDVAVCEGKYDVDTAIFLATDGGVVRLDSGGIWKRLYSDPGKDGMAAIPIFQLAGLDKENLMANTGSAEKISDRRLFAFSAKQDLWQTIPNELPSEDKFRQLKATVSDDPNGWRILDLYCYKGLSGPRPSSPDNYLSIAWKGQPVWLVEKEEDIRFAHDTINSVAVRDRDVWTATSGGCVRYKLTPKGVETLELISPEIHASDLLGTYDPWSPPSPPNAGIVRTTSNKDGIVCYMMADTWDLQKNKDGPSGEKSCYILRSSQKDFSPVVLPRDSREEIERCLIGFDDGFWYWKKLGPQAMEMKFYKNKADLPNILEEYELVRDGTFRFFDTMYQSDRKSRERTMVVCFDRIFFITAGGIMSYDAKTVQAAKLYAATEPDQQGKKTSLEDVREMYYDSRQQTLFARKRDRGVFVYLPAKNNEEGQWKIYENSDDPFVNANVVVDNELLRWRQLEDGPVVTLTSSDMPPAASYKLFHNGKFSFDYVHSLAFKNDKIWLATAGGVVRVDKTSHTIEFIYAKDFPFVSEGDLSNVREIIVDKRDSGNIYARTESMQSFWLDSNEWKKISGPNVESAFQREYTRFSNDFWTWVQPPHGVYVQLHKTVPPNLNFGKASPDSHTTLMSRGRLAWDDLREALVVGNQLFFSTPAGICSYDCNFGRQETRFDHIYGKATSGANQSIPMLDLERVIRDENDILTWNQSKVFRGKRTKDGWQWEVEQKLTPAMMVSQKELKSPWGKWVLQRKENEKSITARFVPTIGLPYKKAFDLGEKIPDMSYATISKSGIWFPTDRDVVWLDVSFIKWRRAALILLALMFLCGLLFIAKDRFREKVKT
jgi:hypothetical protein